MRTIALVSMAALLAVGLGLLAGCKAEPQGTPATGKSGAPGAAAGAKAEIAQKLCPVTGDPINPNLFVDYKDRRIYFCCDMCPPEFKKDPEKYLKIVDDQLKAGVSAPAEGDRPGPQPVAPAAAQKAGIWTCPMHPEVRADGPGKCPKCGMALAPAPQSK